MDGSSTASAVASSRMRSGVTSLTANSPDCGVSDMTLYRLLHFFGGGENVFDSALQVEGLFRNVVVLAFDDLPEAADRVRNLDVGAGDTGEDFGYVEGLREEALDFAGAGYGDLVLFGEFVDAEDGDDVLEVLVALQNLLHALGDVVVLLADDARSENARGGGQRVYGGIDSQLGEGA